jgi:hypothetical protein
MAWRCPGRPQLEPAAEFAEIGVRHKGSYSLHHCWDEFDGVRSYADECAKLSLELKFDHTDADAWFDGFGAPEPALGRRRPDPAA